MHSAQNPQQLAENGSRNESEDSDATVLIEGLDQPNHADDLACLTSAVQYWFNYTFAAWERMLAELKEYIRQQCLI